MGRAPCCDKEGLKKGPWTAEEDKILIDYIQSNGNGSWRSLPKLAGLLRCGKSCRLRWTNYLRPDIKRGPFTPDEQKTIIQLHGIVGNKWSTIAAQLPGRTDNEVKNYWNTHLKKRLLKMGIDPDTYAPASSPSSASPAVSSSPSTAAAAAVPSSSATRHMAQWESARLEAEARLAKDSLLFSALSASAGDTSGADTAGQEGQSTTKPEADFFLRIWNSEVGQAFRSKETVMGSSPASSSTKGKSDVVVKEEECGGVAADIKKEECSGDVLRKEEDVECKSSGGSVVVGGFVGAESSSSEEVVEETAVESYQMFLDFAAMDDMGMGIGSLFHGHLGSFSLFGNDDMNVDWLDYTAFKWVDGEKTRV